MVGLRVASGTGIVDQDTTVCSAISPPKIIRGTTIVLGHIRLLRRRSKVKSLSSSSNLILSTDEVAQHTVRVGWTGIRAGHDTSSILAKREIR